MSNKPFQGAVEGLRLAEKYLALGEPERSFLFQSNAQTQATLALAHEQRTANLIEYAKVSENKGLLREVAVRLGIEQPE